MKKYINFSFAILILLSATAAQTFAQTCAPAPSGLQAWYRAENNALDLRSRNNGTLQSGATFAAGHVGQAFSFDGINDFVDVPNSASLDSWTTQATFEAWINPQSQSGATGFVFARRTPGVFEGFSVAVYNEGGGLDIKITIGTNTFDVDSFITTGGALTLNQWQHIAVTINLTTNSKQIYINGQPQPLTGDGGDGNLSSNFNGVNRFFFGQRQAGLSFYKGALDEPAFYTSELSQSQIQAVHAAGQNGKCKPTATLAPSGQVAWFAGDGNANDIAGTNNGTLENGASHAVGKVGQSFNFTAQNQSVGTPNNPALFPPNALSIEAWVNPSTYAGCSAQYRIFHTVRAVLRGYVTFIDCSSQKLVGQIFNSSGTANSIGSNATIPAGTFTHIAMTWDGSNLRLYINGILDNTAATTITAIGTNTDPLRIGNEFNFGFKGQIDELSLYNRALTGDEITSIADAGLAGKLKDKATPTGSTVVVNANSDATITFPTVSTAGTTQQIPLDANVLPAIPYALPTGLFYDVATSAAFTGSPIVCFNLPSFTPAQFASLQIYHLENNQWRNRTAAPNLYPNLCSSGLTSLSPFAVVRLPPTAAQVSVGGRVRETEGGKGIFRATVSLTDQSGATRETTTDRFGFYRFADVPAGAAYVLSASHKRFVFESQIVFTSEELGEVNFTPSPSEK